MASRQQSIKVKIIMLLAVPLAALIALWAFAASPSLVDTHRLLKVKSFNTKLIQPTQAMVVELQQERRLSLGVLGVGQEADRSALEAQRGRTNATRAAFWRSVRNGGLRDDLPADVTRQMDALSGRLVHLDDMRASVDAAGVSRPNTFDEFNALIDGAFTIYNAVTTSNAQIQDEVRRLTGLGRSREMLSREDALVTGVLAARRITPAERETLARLVGSQRFEYGEIVPLLPTADRDRYQALLAAEPYQRLRQFEDSLVRGAKGERPAVGRAAWDGTVPALMTQIRGLEAQALAGMSERAQTTAINVLVRLALTGGLGLVAIIASIVIAVRISRRVVGEVRALSGAVGDFTTERLPQLAERIREGEAIQDDDVAPLPPFTVTEIRRLSGAFDAARKTIISAAQSEMAARRSVSEVYVNLARRNQALLHRQLGLLDTMERRVEDPQELGELFRLDHLATRMRRHAESLVILAGRKAGRTWRNPVPFVDVIRGAIAEVEDYTRVQVLPIPRAALTGAAVADTIHLLAELIENGTMFSPPQTSVQVSGQMVPSGFAIEVEDRGLGMSAELMRELNQRLSEGTEFDLFDSARLGTFVVARLAHRHEVQVSLRPSPYGGTTAVVLIPATLIVSEDLIPPAPAAEGDGSGSSPVEAPAAGPSLVPDLVDNDGSHPTVPSFIMDAARKPSSATLTSVGSASAQDAVPGARTVRFGGPEIATEEAGSHKGMPRRRRKTAQVVAEPSGTEPGTESEPDGQSTHLGMPKRTRQASLAPQLRSGSQEPAGDGDSRESMEDGRTDSGSERCPEELRRRMSAMQSGWQRGRSVADPAAVSAADRSSQVTAEPSAPPVKQEDTP